MITSLDILKVSALLASANAELATLMVKATTIAPPDERSTWILYVADYGHVDTVPLPVQKTMQLHGAFCPIVATSINPCNCDYSDAITPGYRPPVFRGEGLEMQGRQGDWVVRSSATHLATSDDGPYQAIVICVVEYDPIAEDDQRWSGCRVRPPSWD